jgi:hypothetical protein
MCCIVRHNIHSMGRIVNMIHSAEQVLLNIAPRGCEARTRNALPGLQCLASLSEDAVKHRTGQFPSERVLLTRVVRSNKCKTPEDI